jgi:hypothetical protein
MGLSVRRPNSLDDRDWSKRPLFTRPRRGYLRWWLLLVLLLGVLLYLYPGSVAALIASLFPA